MKSGQVRLSGEKKREEKEDRTRTASEQRAGQHLSTFGSHVPRISIARAGQLFLERSRPPL